jgi:hypothetical protein
MKKSVLRTLLAALFLVTVACGGGSGENASTGEAPSSKAKAVGSACTCDNPDTGFGPSNLSGCGGCLSESLSCLLPQPIGPGQSGQGTCVQTCTRADEGSRGSCPQGTTCSSHDGTLLCQ